MRYGITDENSDPSRIPQREDWHRVSNLANFPYFTMSDVQKVYIVLNEGSRTGLKPFSKKARNIAEKIPQPEIASGYTYQFKNENALFNLFMEKFSTRMHALGLTDWNKLMQYIA